MAVSASIKTSSMSVFSKKTKKGIHWYYQVMKQGVYHRGGGYESKRDAELAQADERRAPAPRPDMDCGDLFDKYLDYIQARNQSERWYGEKKDFIKDHLAGWYRRPPESITSHEIEDLILQKAKTSPYMANKWLKFMKAIFNFAVDREIIDRNPCNTVKKVQVAQRAKTIPTPEDLNKILSKAKPIDQKYLTLTFILAARPGEVLDLKWSDIQGDTIILRTRKHIDGGLREDRLRLSPLAQAVIAELRRMTGDDREYVFLNKRTRKRYLRRPKLLPGLCRAAGVPRYTLSSLRTLAASVLSDEGVPLASIQEKLRHQKVTTTDHYVRGLEKGRGVAEAVLDGVVNQQSIIEHSTKFSKKHQKRAKTTENVGTWQDITCA